LTAGLYFKKNELRLEIHLYICLNLVRFPDFGFYDRFPSDR
jgi:hypothetical protein